MGSWGYKAYDNDTAADWVMEQVVPVIGKTLRSPYTEAEEVLAALALAADLKLVPWIAWEDIERALARVKASDKKVKWRDPKKRAAYLRSLRARLKRGRKASAWTPMAAMNGSKRKKRTHPRKRKSKA